MIISAITNRIFNHQPSQNDMRQNRVALFDNSFPSFQGTTSAGNPLRKLRGVVCPYFGVKMITSAELPRLEVKIDRCQNVGEVVKLLKPYRSFMQKTEKKVFKMFEQVAKEKPEEVLPNILKAHYNEALVKLKLEEFSVLDDVDKISLKLSPEKALDVHHKTTRCRQVIIENNKDDMFKRKVLLDSLEEIKPKRGEKKIYESLKDRAFYLPTSGTSENAFIVKYADRSQAEIAKRIIRASAATIEHVKPNSKQGENIISNFMLVSANANSLRSNMPLSKYIKMFPAVVRNCQKYINQIISIIESGGLRGNEDYPYKIKKTLQRESGGRIDLNLDEFCYSEKDARRLARSATMKHKQRAKR